MGSRDTRAEADIERHDDPPFELVQQLLAAPLFCRIGREHPPAGGRSPAGGAVTA